MNIFKDSSAPYVLVLLISGVGWLFNSALENIQDLRVLEYWYERGEDKGINTVTVYVENKSMFSAVSEGKINLGCPLESDSGTCLEILPRVNAEAQYVGVSNIGIPKSPVTSEAGMSVDALLPPKSIVAYRVGVKSVDTQLIFGYVLEEEDIEGDKSGVQIRIINRDDPIDSSLSAILERSTIYVVSNYLTVLMALLILLLVFVCMFFIIQMAITIFGKSRGRDDTSTGAKYLVTIGDNEHVATVEKN